MLQKTIFLLLIFMFIPLNAALVNLNPTGGDLAGKDTPLTIPKELIDLEATLEPIQKTKDILRSKRLFSINVVIGGEAKIIDRGLVIPTKSKRNLSETSIRAESKKNMLIQRINLETFRTAIPSIQEYKPAVSVTIEGGILTFK